MGLVCSPLISLTSSAKDSTDCAFGEASGLVSAVSLARWRMSPPASWDFPPFSRTRRLVYCSLQGSFS